MVVPKLRRVAALCCVVACGGSGSPLPAASPSGANPAQRIEVPGPLVADAVPAAVQITSHAGARVAPAEPGWLGVGLSGRAADQPGVLISSVLRRSPAAVGGLQVGDIVLGIDDARVNKPEELSRLIAQKGAGHRASLMLERERQQRLLAVQMGQNPGLEGQLKLGFLDAPAPEFERVEVARGDVGPTLQALRGRVVVLEFWATWCGACRALLPTLNGWHERYQAGGALVLSITTDPVAKAARDAVELGLEYPVLSDPDGATAQLYQAFALPTVFLIDQAGVVRHVSVGYDPKQIAELEATLERLVSAI